MKSVHLHGGKETKEDIHKMARKYLDLPATSTPSERVFSIAGSIVNKKRACLLPENVNMLVFLYENLPK